MSHIPHLRSNGFYASDKLWYPCGLFERALGWFIKPAHFQGLYLPRCKAVHSFGMRHPIQIVWVDTSGRLVRAPAVLKPWRMAVCLEAYGVVEMTLS